MPLNAGAISQILPFAFEGDIALGDLETLPVYTASLARRRGHFAGLAPRENFNRVLRQQSLMTAGMAQYIANRHAPGVVDDADLDKVEAGMAAAVASQVNILVTRATPTQAQGWIESTAVLTPAGLNAAFQGANQNLGTTGYQKTPGGKIEQWSVAALTSSTPVTLPFAFPNHCTGVFVGRTSSSSGDMEYCQITSVSRTGFSAIALVGNATFAGGSFELWWKAEGY